MQTQGLVEPYGGLISRGKSQYAKGCHALGLSVQQTEIQQVRHINLMGMSSAVGDRGALPGCKGGYIALSLDGVLEPGRTEPGG